MKLSTPLVALASVYLIWGSTYLAIGIGVAVMPPYLFAACRFVAAGLILLLLCRALGYALPATGRDWRTIFLTSLLLLVGANGLVTWSQQWVASNQAALIVATAALWTAGIGSLGPRGEKLAALTWGGLVLGFAGVAVLVGEGLFTGAAPLGAYSALTLSPLLWAIGSIHARRNPQGCPPLIAAALQMLMAGAVMAGIGVALGEPARWQTSPRALAALAYLVVFGSCIAYGAYYWLVHQISPALLGTNAYVNPAIAVLVGATIGGEVLSPMQMAGTGVILVGVLIVIAGQRRPARST